MFLFRLTFDYKTKSRQYKAFKRMKKKISSRSNYFEIIFLRKQNKLSTVYYSLINL